MPQTESATGRLRPDAGRRRRDDPRAGSAWSAVQASPRGGYDWSGLDATVRGGRRSSGLEVLPFLYSTPHWVSGRLAAAARSTAAAQPPRPGAHSSAPRSNATGAAAQLLGRHTGRGVEAAAAAAADPRLADLERGELLLLHPAGLAARVTRACWRSPDRAIAPRRPARRRRHRRHSSAQPRGRGRRGRSSAAEFLDRALPRPRRQGRASTTSPCTPTRPTPRPCAALVEEVRATMLRHGDRRSGHLPDRDRLGLAGRPRPRRLRGRAAAARRANCPPPTATCSPTAAGCNLQQVDWFSWKDLPGSCNFCDSAGLFHAGAGFRPKPAWHAFVRVAR